MIFLFNYIFINKIKNMRKIIITEEERGRILGMHNKAIKKEFLMEDADDGDPEWGAYVESANSATKGLVLTTYTTIKPEEAKKGDYAVSFQVKSVETGIYDQNFYDYQCIDELPDGFNFKAGQVYDRDTNKLTPDIITGLNDSKRDYRKIFAKGCKAAYPYKKVDPQVAAAEARQKAEQERLATKEKENADLLAARKAESAKMDKDRADIASKCKALLTQNETKVQEFIRKPNFLQIVDDSDKPRSAQEIQADINEMISFLSTASINEYPCDEGQSINPQTLIYIRRIVRELKTSLKTTPIEGVDVSNLPRI